MRLFLGLVLLAAMISGCSSGTSIVRRRGDVEADGRKIPSAAYAWYLRGIAAEAADEPDRARYCFSRAIRHDPRSAAAYAGLVRSLCSLKDESMVETARHGASRGDRPGLVHAAEGECWLSRGKAEVAEDILQQALSNEPYHVRVNALLHRAMREQGKEAGAARLATAYRLSTGFELPSGASDKVLSDGAPEQLEKIDVALREEELPRARALSVGHVSPGALAARALAWGKRELARQQAQLVHEADRADPDAQIVLALLALPLSRSSRPATSRRPSLVGVLLLATELDRSLQVEATGAWLSPYQVQLASSHDPLVIEMRQRFELSAAPLTPPERANSPTAPVMF